MVTFTTAGDAAFTVRTTGSELATYVELDRVFAEVDAVRVDEGVADVGVPLEVALSADDPHAVISTSAAVSTAVRTHFLPPVDPWPSIAHLLGGAARTALAAQ